MKALSNSGVMLVDREFLTMIFDFVRDMRLYDREIATEYRKLIEVAKK